VIDPYGGMEDIKRRSIKALGDDALVSDPLRMLRAFRLSQQLEFNIDTPTFLSVSTLAGRIKDVSAERVRDELYLMLKAPGAASTFRRMAEAGLLAEVFPETREMAGLVQGEPHVYDLLTHSLMAMEFSEKVMEKPGRYFGKRAQELREYLDGEADGGLDMLGLVKLAALLHDSGKPSAMRYEYGRVRFIGHDDGGASINDRAAERLRLSARAARALVAITRWHMRPLHMSKQGLTRHALYRYARDMGEDLPGSLVVALSDAFATRGRPDAIWTDVEGVALAASDYYYGEYLKEKEDPLIRGRDLIEIFGLKPGPLFSELIEEVSEKRAEGKIKDREEAINYLKEKIKPLFFL
jgi:poly(A) polymerase